MVSTGLSAKSQFSPKLSSGLDASDWISTTLSTFSVPHRLHSSERMSVLWSSVPLVADLWFSVAGTMFRFTAWDGADATGSTLRRGAGRGRRCVHMHVTWGCEGVYIKMDRILL